MVKRIASVQHELVKHLVKLRQNHDYRIDHQRLVIDGIKPVKEVCGKIKAKTLIALDETLIPKGVKAEEVILVNEDVMKKISGMQSPEGLVAEIGMPKPANLKGKNRIVVLDGVSDPGNVGTLLRTALAMGWDGAFIIEESCDPFNEKAIRAARGATFRLPLAWGKWDHIEKLVKENKLEPLVADLGGVSLEDVKAKGGILLVLGNEAHGPSPKAKSLCKPVTIPMSGDMESLNVSIAGGIMMYVLKT